MWALKLRRLQDKIGAVNDGQDDMQMFSSQAETTEAENTDQQMAKHLTGTPKLIDTLALCYLAAMLLRLPISIGDLHRHVISSDCFCVLFE